MEIKNTVHFTAILLFFKKENEMSEIKKSSLQKMIKSHCEAVMASLVNKAGSVGELVSSFVCIPEPDLSCPFLMDMYRRRLEIDEALSTDVMSIDLDHLGVNREAGLDYSLYVEINDFSTNSLNVSCFFTKKRGEFFIEWHDAAED